MMEEITGDLGDLFLVEPSREYEHGFLDMADDFFKHGESGYPKYYNRGENFDDYLKKLSDFKEGKNVLPKHVRQELYWLVNREHMVIGSIRYRPELNEIYKIEGGTLDMTSDPQ